MILEFSVFLVWQDTTKYTWEWSVKTIRSHSIRQVLSSSEFFPAELIVKQPYEDYYSCLSIYIWSTSPANIRTVGWSWSQLSVSGPTWKASQLLCCSNLYRARHVFDLKMARRFPYMLVLRHLSAYCRGSHNSSNAHAAIDCFGLCQFWIIVVYVMKVLSPNAQLLRAFSFGVLNVKYLAHQKTPLMRYSKCYNIWYIWTILFHLWNGTDRNAKKKNYSFSL